MHIPTEPAVNGSPIGSAIDRSYTLNEVPDAIHYLEEGHAQGKTVITV